MSALARWHDLGRLGLAALAVVAMTYQFAVLNVEPGYAKANFFSFFTIQSNILAATLLAVLVVVRRRERSALFDAVRSGIVLYILVTGVVFALLLSGRQEELQTAISWVDLVVHKLVPIALVVDWYPYPFVDVSSLGYDGVLARAAGLMLAGALAALALAALGNRLGAGAARRSAPARRGRHPGRGTCPGTRARASRERCDPLGTKASATREQVPRTLVPWQAHPRTAGRGRPRHHPGARRWWSRRSPSRNGQARSASRSSCSCSNAGTVNGSSASRTRLGAAHGVAP